MPTKSTPPAEPSSHPTPSADGKGGKTWPGADALVGIQTAPEGTPAGCPSGYLSVSTPREDLSLAVQALRESAAAARLAAMRMRMSHDKLAPAYEAKAAKMDAAVKRFSSALNA